MSRIWFCEAAFPEDAVASFTLKRTWKLVMFALLSDWEFATSVCLVSKVKLCAVPLQSLAELNLLPATQSYLISA